jgi:vacuolar iron transporter family protein
MERFAGKSPERQMQYALEHSHTREAIHARLESGPRSNYLRDWIYGGIDGAVTTFAIVAGVAGADLAAAAVLVLGFASVLADGLAMAASNYIGTKAERDDYDRVLGIEKKHIALVPDGEREEIRQIFAAKGFLGEDLERIVAVITSDRAVWARTMAVEEYGLSPTQRSPVLAALSTFAAFIVCVLVPLVTPCGTGRPAGRAGTRACDCGGSPVPIAWGRVASRVS